MTRIDARPGEATQTTPAPAEQAPVAGNNGAGSPESPKPKKKGPSAKVPYPGLEQGKLTNIPDDFNPSKHAALKEEDFDPKNLDVFYKFKSDEYRRKADQWSKKADRFKTLGGVSDRKTAMKMGNHLDALIESVKKLIAQGDVDAVRQLPPELLKMAGVELPPVER